MKISVKLFGLGETLSEQGSRKMELPEGTSVTRLAEEISKTAGINAEQLMRRSTVFVNREKVKEGEVLQEGDEVMFIFTLGGG